MSYGFDDYEGVGFVEKTIQPLVGGRVRYQGSIWPARSADNSIIHEAEAVTIVGRELIQLVVTRY